MESLKWRVREEINHFYVLKYSLIQAQTAQLVLIFFREDYLLKVKSVAFAFQFVKYFQMAIVTVGKCVEKQAPLVTVKWGY